MATVSKKQQEIIKHPGRELDALVAVNVLGWRWVKFGRDQQLSAMVPPANIYDKPGWWHPSDPGASRYDDWDMIHWEDSAGRLHHGLPFFSTNIEAAWQLWDILVDMKRYPTLQEGVDESGDVCVWLSLVNPASIEVWADSVPHAICLAVLAALEERP